MRPDEFTLSLGFQTRASNYPNFFITRFRVFRVVFFRVPGYSKPQYLVLNTRDFQDILSPKLHEFLLILWKCLSINAKITSIFIRKASSSNFSIWIESILLWSSPEKHHFITSNFPGIAIFIIRVRVSSYYPGTRVLGYPLDALLEIE